MSLDGLAALLAAGLAAGAPIALAALGGLLTEAAGALSVALEGAMLAGAFAAAAVAVTTGNAALGLAAGLVAGALVGLLVGYAAGRLRADVFVAGLAANLLAPGAASLLSEEFFGTKGVIPAPALAGAPVFAVMALAAIVIVAAYSLTPFGLRLRAVGERNEAARAAGLNSGAYRLGAHLAAGAAAGLAGAALASKIGAFVPGMSSGRGWIALVAIYLGAKRPGGVLLASLAFGLLISLSNAAQAFKDAPAELFLGLPYLVTALALILGKALSARKAAGRGGRWLP